MQWRSRRGEARLYFPQLHFSHTPVPQILRWLTSCCSRPVYKLWQTLYVIMMHHFRFGKAATFWYFQSAHAKCRRDCPNFSTLDHYYVYYQRRSKQLTQHTVIHQKKTHQQQHCTPRSTHLLFVAEKTFKGSDWNQSTPTTHCYSRNPKVLGELGNTIALRAKRKIKKGEELTISYVPFFRFLIIPLMFYIDQVQMAFVVHLRSLRVLSLKFTRPRNVLRQELKSNWNFSCQCIRWTSFKDF